MRARRKLRCRCSKTQPLPVKDFDVPEPTWHQVRVRIAVSGMYGAQIRIRGVKGPDAFLPHLLGHEGSGTVERSGDLVTKTVPGDRVVLHWRTAAGGAGVSPRYRGTDGYSAGADTRRASPAGGSSRRTM